MRETALRVRHLQHGSRARIGHALGRLAWKWVLHKGEIVWTVLNVGLVQPPLRNKEILGVGGGLGRGREG